LSGPVLWASLPFSRLLFSAAEGVFSYKFIRNIESFVSRGKRGFWMFVEWRKSSLEWRKPFLEWRNRGEHRCDPERHKRQVKTF
jgi:hypothetical protein